MNRYKNNVLTVIRIPSTGGLIQGMNGSVIVWTDHDRAWFLENGLPRQICVL